MPSKKSKKTHEYRWLFDAIGTRWSIETDRSLSNEVKQKVMSCIDTFDRTYSRFRDDSKVSKIYHNPGEYHLDDNSSQLSRLYRQLYDATDGAVTPLIGEGLVAAGYDKNYSLSPSMPSLAPVWDDDFVWKGRSMRTKRPVLVDVGAAGKGCLIDNVADIMEKEGFSSYVIDASGDMKHRGRNTEMVGLENPYDTSRVIGVVPLQNASLCASATNRRRWTDGWHHVLDGRTSLPTTTVVATWVVAELAMMADGLATALFFVNPNKLEFAGDFQFVRLFGNGKVEYSKNFVGELYI